jgi:hypothetical protein
MAGGTAFAAEFHGRKPWCRENCRGGFAVEPIRPEGAGRDTERRFLFADSCSRTRLTRRRSVVADADAQRLLAR